MENIKTNHIQSSKSTAKAVSNRAMWQMMGVAAITLAIGWSIGSLRNTAGDTVAIDSRSLQIEARRLEQQVSALQAQVGDYKNLQQVQQEMIEQLRAGNQKLQNRLYGLQEDFQKATAP